MDIFKNEGRYPIPKEVHLWLNPYCYYYFFLFILVFLRFFKSGFVENRFFNTIYSGYGPPQLLPDLSHLTISTFFSCSFSLERLLKTDEIKTNFNRTKQTNDQKNKEPPPQKERKNKKHIQMQGRTNWHEQKSCKMIKPEARL